MSEKLRLVEFIVADEEDGESKFSINPATVVYIGEHRFNPQLASLILLGSKEPIIVKGSYAEVKERCLS